MSNIISLKPRLDDLDDIVELLRRTDLRDVETDLDMSEHEPLAVAEHVIEHYTLSERAQHILIRTALVELKIRLDRGEPLACDIHCNCGWRPDEQLDELDKDD